MSDSDLVVRGLPLWSPIPEISIGKQIYDSLKQCTNEEVAYVNAYTDEKLLYTDFLKFTCQLANSLQNCEYKINDVIGICSENTNNFFIPIVSALYLGMIAAPLGYTYTDRELLHTLNLTKPKVVFCSKEVLSRFETIKKTLNFIERIIILDSDDKIDEYDTIMEFMKKYTSENFRVENFKTVEIDSFQQLAGVLCSSGTTGPFKSVIITHDNISTRINHARDPRISLFGRVILGLMPFSNVYGFTTNICAIIDRSMVVAFNRFEVDVLFKSVQKYRINILYLVPSLMLLLAKSPLVSEYDFSNVEQILCGGAPLSAEIEADVKRRLPTVKVVRKGYGLTECTLCVTVAEHNDLKTGSCGKVVPGMSGVIKDLETGQRLGPNEVGELCFKGRLITKGYYGDEEATRSTYSPDGWLYTGDIGYYDKDHHFHVIDRLKELIKYKAFQVAPAELESILIHHPEVQDVGVVGKPDESAGELPTAFIVKKPNSTVTEQQIKDYVAHEVSHPKWLRGGVYFVEHIPRTPSGKVLRRHLRDLIPKLSDGNK